MRFLVTGGAGFIGSNLAEELCKMGEVCIVDDLSSGNIENIKHLLNEIEFSETSILEYRKLLKATEGVDYVFHQAALSNVTASIDNPKKANKVNVTGTLNVLEAAKKNKIEKLVYASSASIYGDTATLPISETMRPDPQSPYAASKLASEHYCKVYTHIYGLPTVSLRYFNVYGPRQNPYSQYSAVVPKFISQIIRGKSPTIFGYGNTTRDFIYVKDIVQANIQAIKSDAVGVFNAAYGAQTSLNQLAQKIMDLTGNQVDLNYGPERPGDIKDSYADISKACETLHYQPKYDIEKGLDETIRWYSDNLR